MIPIQDLLHRIQWDPGFGHAGFTIGYFDRVADRIIHVPLSAMRFRGGEHPALEATEKEGGVRTVPLHRVREVWRDGEVIWRRPQAP